MMRFPFHSILIVLILNAGLSAQNHWDSVLPEKSEGSQYYVFGENVNVRKETNLKAEVVTKLQSSDRVRILKKTNQILTVGEQKEFWYQIQIGEKKGFVWGALLADSSVELGGNLLLIRNPGAHTQKLEFKACKDGKVVSTYQFAPGPVANENWSFHNYQSTGFSPSPGLLIGFRYLVYSEIEYAQPSETILSIDPKGKISEFYSWYPGGCDPPSCVETWLVFPSDTLASDKTIGRKEYKGQTNSILQISRSYDLDDTAFNEYSHNIRIWNGKNFQDKK